MDVASAGTMSHFTGYATTQALLPSETISPVGMTFQLTCRDNMGSCVPIRLVSYCFIEARSPLGIECGSSSDVLQRYSLPIAARQRTGSFSPNTSLRLRSSKVDMLYDTDFFHEDAVFYDPKCGIFRGRDEIDRMLV
jgi:hypothetical protein